MFTIESQEFFAKQQRFVFIRPDVDIDPETDLPHNTEDYQVVDADDLATIGVPMDSENEDVFELWAVLEPGETLESED